MNRLPDAAARVTRPVSECPRRGVRRSMRRSGPCALVLLLSLLVETGVSGAEPELRFPELFHRLSRNVVSPHIAWARPFAGRKLRAVVIGPRWGQRETVELMERFEIDCTPVCLQSDTEVYCEGRHWGHEQVKSIWKEAVLKELADALAGPLDVIVLGRVPARKFPAEVLEAIKTRVQAGAGLVYLWPDHQGHAAFLNVVREGLGEEPRSSAPDASGEGLEPLDSLATMPPGLRFLTTGVPLEALPGLRVADRAKEIPKLVTVRKVGKGRAVCVAYRGGGDLLTPTADVDLHYEYYQSFVIKALLVAAGVEPAAVFERFPPRVAGGEFAFAVRNGGDAVEVVVTLSVRSPDPLFQLPSVPTAAAGVAQTAAALMPVHREERKLRCAHGSTTVRFALPELPAGEYFADVELATAAGKVNWATTIMRAESPVAISELLLSPQAVDLAGGEQQVKASAALTAPAHEGTSLHFALLDNFDRLLSERSVAVEPGAKACEAALAVSCARSTLLKVRVELRMGGKPKSIKTAFATATNRGWGDFTFFAWGGVGQGYVARQQARILAGLGIDAFRGGTSLAALQVADVRCVPDLWRFGSPVENKTLKPCYSDPTFRKELADGIRQAAAKHVPFDAYGFLCGDEWGYMQTNTPHDACWSPSCIARFRAYLKTQYGTVANLNEQWGTVYAAFDAVEPITIKEMKEAAKETRNYSRLIDQWVCNFGTFADAFRFVGDSVRQVAPRQRFGYSTPLWNWWYRGYNWPAIVPQCGFASPYGPWGDMTHSESARSFAAPGTLLSMHYGSYVTPSLNDEGHFRMVPYVILFNGFGNAFWYTTWGNEGGVSPWLDPYPCLARSSEEVARIKAGLGRLLLGAKRETDAIAIHYSMPSYIFSFLVSGPHVPWRINSLAAVLEELGYQYQFVSDAQVVDGALEGYKALVLPVSQCIGDAEAAKIRQFVEGGGLAIADVRPGIADEHGKVGGRRAIAELFGLKWDATLAPLVKRDVEFSGTCGGLAFRGTVAKGLDVDPSVSLAGAEAALRTNGVPLVTHQRAGKGAAVCLNFPAGDLGGNLHNLLGTLLSAHNVRPAVTIRGLDGGLSPGAWLLGFELSRFTDGAATYLGLTRRRLFAPSDDMPGTVALDLGGHGHVYDVLGGRYLGRLARLDVVIGPSQAKLFAVLPHRVDALHIKLDSEDGTRGQTLRGTVRVLGGESGACRHVIHLTVTRPGGQVVRYLTVNLDAPKGVAQFAIPLCLNEPPGAWALTCTDTATKASASVAFDVKASR